MSKVYSFVKSKFPGEITYPLNANWHVNKSKEIPLIGIRFLHYNQLFLTHLRLSQEPFAWVWQAAYCLLINTLNNAPLQMFVSSPLKSSFVSNSRNLKDAYKYFDRTC